MPCVQVSHHLNITNNNCWFSLMNPKIVVVPKSFFYFYCLAWADNCKLRWEAASGECGSRPTHEVPIPMSHHPSLVLRFLLQPYDFCGSHLLLMSNDLLRLLYKTTNIIFWLQIEQSTSKTYCDFLFIILHYKAYTLELLTLKSIHVFTSTQNESDKKKTNRWIYHIIT